MITKLTLEFYATKLASIQDTYVEKKKIQRVVEKLFTYGFIDKIYVDNDFYCISKLPTIIMESAKAMMESFGTGIYGIQIFDVSTNLVGKPIVICQMFKIGKKFTIDGHSTDLKKAMACTLEKFQNWITEKRVVGLLALKGKINDMLKAGEANIIGTSKGGDIDEIITLYYHNQNTLSHDAMELAEMQDMIVNLKHKHAKQTIEQYHLLIDPRKRPSINTQKTPDKRRKMFWSFCIKLYTLTAQYKNWWLYYVSTAQWKIGDYIMFLRPNLN